MSCTAFRSLGLPVIGNYVFILHINNIHLLSVRRAVPDWNKFFYIHKHCWFFRKYPFKACDTQKTASFAPCFGFYRSLKAHRPAAAGFTSFRNGLIPAPWCHPISWRSDDIHRFLVMMLLLRFMVNRRVIKEVMDQEVHGIHQTVSVLQGVRQLEFYFHALTAAVVVYGSL